MQLQIAALTMFPQPQEDEVTEETTTTEEPTVPTFGEIRDLCLTQLKSLLTSSNSQPVGEARIKSAQTLFQIANEADWKAKERLPGQVPGQQQLVDGEVEPLEADVVEESDNGGKKKKKKKKAKQQAEEE